MLGSILLLENDVKKLKMYHLGSHLEKSFDAILHQPSFFKKIRNTLPVLEPLAYGDARRVFHDRMTSAEPWEKRKVKKSSFPSLQVLITLIFGANPCKIHSYCLFCIGSPLILHKKCIDLSDPHFRDIAAPKSCSRFKGKMTFHSRFFPTAPLMSGGHRKVYERSRIVTRVKPAPFA